MRRVPPLLLVVIIAAYGAQKLFGGEAAEPSPGGSLAAHVVRVVDGDTIRVVLDGAGDREEAVRYIGVDTPETVKPGAPVECFGKKASAANRALLDGREVRLVFDAEERDRYGRLLAYVHRADDDLFVNAELVRRGYATTLTIPPNVRYADRFRRLAAAARQARRGLWSACER